MQQGAGLWPGVHLHSELAKDVWPTRPLASSGLGCHFLGLSAAEPGPHQTLGTARMLAEGLKRQQVFIFSPQMSSRQFLTYLWKKPACLCTQRPSKKGPAAPLHTTWV